MLWNIDPRDYRIQSEAHARQWSDEYNPADGDIVLLHDNYPWASQIVHQLVERGLFDRFRTVNVSDMVSSRRHSEEWSPCSSATPT